MLGGGLSGVVDVVFDVVDINDHPPSCPDTVLEVRENERIGTYVGQVRQHKEHWQITKTKGS